VPGVTSTVSCKESCLISISCRLAIVLPSIPAVGAKSRVETQIRVAMDLAHATVASVDPLQYDLVGSWKYLRLPKGTATKRRPRKDGRIGVPYLFF
jgi:uncharacterized protein